jgi:hypothetical protein
MNNNNNELENNNFPNTYEKITLGESEIIETKEATKERIEESLNKLVFKDIPPSIAKDLIKSINECIH